MSARLPNQLHDLASEMRVDLERTSPPTLRRARRRRGASAALAVVSIAAIVAVGVAGASILTSADTDGRVATNPGEPTPAPTAVVPPQPAAFPGLWPETDEPSLEATQAAVDDGHSPIRVDAEQTAAMLATNVLGWTHDDVLVTTLAHGGTAAMVQIANATFDGDVPPIEVSVAQLGRTGPNGIWSVVGVRSDALEVSIVDATRDGVIAFEGNLLGTVDGAAVAVDVVGATAVDVGFEAGFEPLGGSFFAIDAPTGGGEPRVAWFAVRDASGRTIAATAVPLRDVPPIPMPTPDPAVSPPQDLPQPVADTYLAILEGARAYDIDALRTLLDPNTFVYNFDDGSDPTPIWREDPSVLDLIPPILELPFTVVEIEGYGTFYQWPYLMEEGALDDVSGQEREDLHALGFSDGEIEQMRDYGSYLGPRLSIDADGLWRNYVTGGD